MIKKNPLMDEEFLKKLQEDNAREVFARITALTRDELPVEEIQGKVCDGGNITIDGKSTVRRTCNLTLTAEDVNINEFYWGIKTKIKVEIGLTNLIEPKYPDIIWFPQGMFVLTSFSTTQTTNKWTIKITGKDKMCLLNGELAGSLPHETDFGKEEYHDLETDTVTYTEVPIKNIIRNAVQEFGGELPQNIIINDLDDLGLELLEYRSSSPGYLYKLVESQEYINLLLNDNIKCYYTLPKELTIEQYNLISDERDVKEKYQLVDTKYQYQGTDEERENYEGFISDDFAIQYDNLQTGLDIGNREITEITFSPNGDKYILAKLISGDMPGYFVTDLTYAGDLIAKIGESITSILDKIKNMLTNFEYYYDINGKFIFQKKKEYITMAWNNTDTTDTIQYLNTSVTNQAFMYSFIDGKLVTSFQNTPKITEIKNDYSIWGTYNNNGTEVPIHMRYAIDKKPTSYQPIRPLKEEIVVTVKDSNGQFLNQKTSYKYYDAPEIEPYDDNCLLKKEVEQEEGTVFTDNLSPSITTIVGEDGYTYITKRSLYFAKYPYSVESTEQHYKVDWRELIYQMALDYRKCHNEDDFLYWISQANPDFPSGRTSYEQYYIDFEGFWRTLYNPNPDVTYTKLSANEVDKYTTLLDNNEKNDIYDNVYIKNGLRPIEFNEYDMNILQPKDLFLFDTSGLHKWKTSQWCCLDYDYPYFIRENKEMTMHKASEPDTAEHIALNSIEIDDIYKKKTQEFLVQNKIHGSVNYEVQPDEKNPGGKFSVLSYPQGTSYKLEENDYISVIDEKFNTFFKEWSNFNDCYIKDNQYVKLSESDFFDYYYYSYYYHFQMLASDICATFIDENKDYAKKMENYNNIIDNFYDAIINYDAKDLKTSFETVKRKLNGKIESAITFLLYLCDTYGANDEMTENSYKYNYLKEQLYTIYKSAKQGSSLAEILAEAKQSHQNLKNNYNFANAVIQLRATEDEFDNKKDEIAENLSLLINDYLEKDTVPKQAQLFMNASKVESVEGAEDSIISFINSMSIEEYDKKIYLPCAALVSFVKDEKILTYLISAYDIIIEYFNQLNNLLSLLIARLDSINTIVLDVLTFWIKADGIILLPELYELLVNKDKDGLIEYFENTKRFQNIYYFAKYNNFGEEIEDEKETDNIEYYWGSSDYNKEIDTGNFWNTNIDARPQGLLFWVDFLEPSSSIMEKISVPTIGSRTKVIDDKNVKAIHYKDIPNVIFKRNNDKSETELKSGYTYININKNTENYFSISSKGKSATERLEELLYTNAYCPENITIQTIPVYHLEPNHHVYIQDLKSGIDGEYMVEKITIPLSYNKTMSITASKVVDSIT